MAEPNTDPNANPNPNPSPPWYEGKADAELIGHWDNKGWKRDDPAVIAIEATKAARELQKHFGVPADQLLKLPKDATDEAGWKAVHARLGVPGEAKEYDFTGVKRADGSAVPDSLADLMRNALHSARVPKERAADVVKAVVKHLDDGGASEKAERTARLAAEKAELAKNWGQNAEINRLRAMEGAKRLGVDPATVELLENQVGYSKVMEMFRKIGVGTSEDTFVEGKQGGLANPATLEGAQARKSELMSDQDWVSRYNKGGTAEIREMRALNTIISAAMPALG